MSGSHEAARRFSLSSSGSVVLLAVACVYPLTAAKSLLGGDNGEFIVVAEAGGVAHPPGFPIYVLFLRLMSWLPGATPAHTAALATSLIGIATAAVLYRASRRMGASAAGSGAAVGLYAFSSLAWQMSTQAEVFSLNAFFAALIMLLAAPSSARPFVRTISLGLVAGLALSNHPSIVLMAPLGLYAAISSARTSDRPWLAVGGGLAALVVGLLPYLQVYLDGGVSPSGWRWGETNTVAGFVHHLLRRDYGTLSLGIYSGASPTAQIVALVDHLFRDLLVVGVLGAMVGFGVPLRPSERGVSEPGKPAVVALLATFVLAGPVFIAQFNLPAVGLGARVVERFYLLPQVVLVVPTALGFTRVLAALRSRFDVRAAAVVVPTYLSLIVHLWAVQQSHRPTVELYITNILSQAEPRAVIVGTGDHRLYGMLYAQQLLGLRPDVQYIDATMMLYPWYFRGIASSLGFEPAGVDVERRVASQREFIGSLVASGRPVCLTNPYARGATEAVPLIPLGVLLCALPAGAPGPTIVELEARNREIVQNYVFEVDLPEAGDSWAGAVYEDYARPWRDLAGAFAQSGLPGPAESLLSYANSLTPWLSEP